MITKRGPGEAHRRYRIWRGFDFDEGRVYGSSHRRSWWTGCGWSPLRQNGRIYRSDAEVRGALDRMEADGLAANAEACWG
jgi:hypothetical protein